MNPSPYQQALDSIEHDPESGSATSLAKLILSLYNEQCGFAISECIGNLDTQLTSIALKMVAHYASYGEDEELRRIGRPLADQYERLWQQGVAMRDARTALHERWIEEDSPPRREQAIERLRAALIAYCGPRGPGSWSIVERFPDEPHWPVFGLCYTVEKDFEDEMPHRLMCEGNEPWADWGGAAILAVAALKSDNMASGTYASVEGTKPEDTYYEIALIEVR